MDFVEDELKNIDTVTSEVSSIRTVRLPGSKSITNRALLIAALAKGSSVLNNVLFCDDTRVLMQALESLGVKLSVDKMQKRVVVNGLAGPFKNDSTKVWVENSGTSARFLLAACAASNGRYAFDGTPRMRQRPQRELLTALVKQGAKLLGSQDYRMPLTLQGSDQLLRGGTIRICAKSSSQFVSALLMVAPYMANPCQIIIDGDCVSRPFIDMTLRMMQDFSVDPAVANNKIVVSNEKTYQARKYNIEPDMTLASYFFAAACLIKRPICITDIDYNNSLQGDLQFLSVLKKLGNELMVNNDNQIRLFPSMEKMPGISADFCDFSDTFMTLACMAPFFSSATSIYNIQHTRLQESDRIDAVATNLTKLGVRVETGLDFITIYPGKIKPTVIDSYDDHRIVMSFSLIKLICKEVSITGTQCVNKTCPDFFYLFDRWCGRSNGQIVE